MYNWTLCEICGKEKATGISEDGFQTCEKCRIPEEETDEDRLPLIHPSKLSAEGWKLLEPFANSPDRDLSYFWEDLFPGSSLLPPMSNAEYEAKSDELREERRLQRNNEQAWADFSRRLDDLKIIWDISSLATHQWCDEMKEKTAKYGEYALAQTAFGQILAICSGKDVMGSAVPSLTPPTNPITVTVQEEDLTRNITLTPFEIYLLQEILVSNTGNHFYPVEFFPVKFEYNLVLDNKLVYKHEKGYMLTPLGKQLIEHLLAKI